KYIETRTMDGNPFDIRVHMMKDGYARWSYANIRPRIGLTYATITTIENGGYMGGIDGFVNRNFNGQSQLIKQIKDVSFQIATQFEKLYDHKLSELGLDLAINKNLEISLIEINVNKPGIVLYEFEVAKNAISYAIYLAGNKNQK